MLLRSAEIQPLFARFVRLDLFQSPPPLLASSPLGQTNQKITLLFETLEGVQGVLARVRRGGTWAYACCGLVLYHYKPKGAYMLPILHGYRPGTIIVHVYKQGGMPILMMVLLYYKTGAYYITYICTALPRQEEGQREAITDWRAKHSRGSGSSYGLGT